MEMVNHINKTVTIATYDFYCDHCGHWLGRSISYDDGYYKPLGDFQLEFYTPKGWYYFNKCLCKNHFLTKIYKTLECLGFKNKE